VEAEIETEIGEAAIEGDSIGRDRGRDGIGRVDAEIVEA
jgi:hypothetical protein